MATKKITKEEKLADIAEAKKCFEEAEKLREKGKKLIKRYMRGVEITNVKVERYGWDYNHKSDPEDYSGVEVHLYSGILKLEKLLETKSAPEKDLFGKADYSRKTIYVDGVKFFQLGKATQHKFNYR